MRREFGYAVRSLWRQPLFSMVAVATVGLGLSASVTVMAVIDSLLLRPLPYEEPHRIVRIGGPSPQSFVAFKGSRFALAYPELERSSAFAAIGLYVSGGLNFGSQSPERLSAAAVTPGFFNALGITTVLGQVFTERTIDRDPYVAIISNRLWRRRFGQDLSILGQAITLNGRPFRLVGVLPPRVDFPANSDFWIPSGADSHMAGPIPSPVLIARLRPGVSQGQAREEVTRIFEAYVPSRPEAPARAISVRSLHDSLAGDIRPLSAFVAAAALVVFLLACVNTANLLLARTAARGQEFAMRRALGASSMVLTRQIGAEALVLALAAGLIAVPVTASGLAAAEALLPPTLHGVNDLALTGRTAVIAVVSVVVSTALIAMPASLLMRSQGLEVDRATRGIMDARWQRRRSELVAAEIAIALVLLVASTGLTRAVRQLAAVDLGIEAANTMSLQVDLPRVKYRTVAHVRQFLNHLEKSLWEVQGIDEVGLTDRLFGSLGSAAMIEPLLQGQSAPLGAELAVYVRATQGYFAAAGITLVAGRTFSESDSPKTPPVVVVSVGVADLLGIAPRELVGRRINAETRLGGRSWADVVGVVSDVRFEGPDGELTPAVYVSYSQDTPIMGTIHVVLRSATPASQLVQPVRDTIARIDPTLPIHHVRSLEDWAAQLLAGRRLAMSTLVTFSAVALALSIIGLYGMVTYVVQLRRHDFGVRMAVGAAPKDIQWVVLRIGLVYSGWGAAVGGVLAFGLSAILPAMVPGVPPVSTLRIVSIAALLMLVAVGATWVPAKAASRDDPLCVLRSE